MNAAQAVVLASVCLPGAVAAQWLELPVPERPDLDGEAVEAGRVLYDTHCWTCHGEQGDGKGPIAETLWPRPRDFTIASFKLRTTGSGELPTDEDIFRSITLGLPGTAMPAWESTLSAQERWQVIAYLKTLADGLFEDEAFDPYAAIVGLADEPAASAAALIAAGREVYDRSDCWECHGPVGRGDGEKAPDLEDDWGFPIWASDLEDGWKFRGGRSAREMYLRLSTGLDGTPMPSYRESLTDEERWQVAHYVASLDQEEDRERSAVIRARRVTDAPPARVDAPAWEEAPEVWVPLTGQATYAPRWQTPAVTDVAVRALYDGEQIALRLSWNDRTADAGPADSSRARAEGWTADDTYPALYPEGVRARGTFPDAAEVMTPARLDRGLVLPHFVYGDARRPVSLWRWNAEPAGPAGDGEAFVEYESRGPERPPERLGAQPRLDGEATYADGRWTVVLRRRLATAEGGWGDLRPGDQLPVAFHVWDGANGETGLRMALSSWYYLQLEEPVRASGVLLVLAAVIASFALEIGLIRYMRGRANASPSAELQR